MLNLLWICQVSELQCYISMLNLQIWPYADMLTLTMWIIHEPHLFNLTRFFIQQFRFL